MTGKPAPVSTAELWHWSNYEIVKNAFQQEANRKAQQQAKSNQPSRRRRRK